MIDDVEARQNLKAYTLGRAYGMGDAKFIKYLDTEIGAAALTKAFSGRYLQIQGTMTGRCTYQEVDQPETEESIVSKIQVAGRSCTLLIDGNNLMHRCHHAAKAAQGNLSGNEAQWLPLLFTLRCVRAYAQDLSAASVWIAWDKRLDRNQLNFRQTALQQYKNNRQSDEREKIHSYEEHMRACFEALGIRSMYPNQLEADDVMAWLTVELPGRKVIVTTDADLLQLVDDSVEVFQPKKKILITKENFQATIGVPADRYVEYKALIGDVSDNIPAVTEEQKAKNIILSEYDHDWTDKEKEQINLNHKLMDLSYGYMSTEGEVECYKQQLSGALAKPDWDRFKELCTTYKFNSILNDLPKWERTFSASN